MGQTGSQGASSHCWHMTGWKRKRAFGVLAFPVALDANPVLGAAARRLIVAGRGDIIFGVTGDHAGFAARAAVQIHHHGPFVSHARLFSPLLRNALEESPETLTRLFRVREAAHAAREKNQLALSGSAGSRQL